MSDQNSSQHIPANQGNGLTQARQAQVTGLPLCVHSDPLSLAHMRGLGHYPGNQPPRFIPFASLGR